MSSLWPNQVYALAEVPKRLAAGRKKLLVTGPTGSGKSLIICGLIEHFAREGWYVVVYTNRRMLIDQLARVLTEQGIRFGVRASGYHDDRELKVQVSSLPTERQRVLKHGRWDHHGIGGRSIALVDEAHLNAARTAQQMLARHDAYVGFTATPIELGHLYEELIVAGTASEMRGCGALVPCLHYGPDEPDMRKFKQQLNGEYSEAVVRKAMMTKSIFGRVWEWWQKLNPEQRPSILFAPGVAESLWFAEQFVGRGIPWAHIDGTNVWLDGETYATGPSIREEIVGRLKDGRIKGVSNRFVLREGVDIPQASHGIFATVMGSLQTFLQAGGRLLRACEGKKQATIQDHGGMWWRHGSLNADRVWNLEYTESMIAGLRADRMREKKQQEPLCCPQCGLVRASGKVCPHCGFETKRRSRMVMQKDGTFKEMSGDIFRARRVLYKQNTQLLWNKQYYRARNSSNKMSFRQAEALFFLDNHYYPPRDLCLMPLHELDWFRSVADVPPQRLMGREMATLE